MKKKTEEFNPQAELIMALDMLEKEKGINKAALLDAIETALVSAYKKNYNNAGNVRVSVNGETGEIGVYSIKKVVEELENPAEEIELSEAWKIAPYYQPGDILEVQIAPKDFGRIAAQSAKQVVVQRIREAERGMIYDELSEKENEVLTAIVQREERNGVHLELGRSEGFMYSTEFIPGESFVPGDRIKVYVLEVLKTSKGPQVLVSRTHPGLIKRLFEFEVPEIQAGIVTIKSIAREAGSRTKIAVYSADPQVDPVGACVGQRGIRIERIVAELVNEKVDIIEWNVDPATFIANALSPARVMMVQINEEEHAARVIVPDNQLSLAIGKEGQNARLAFKLTGWKIDIKSQSQSAAAAAAMYDSFPEEPAPDFDDLDLDFNL
ncbi:MAG: transcription termination factor NusA [Christensenellales bacterium]|jgi:N utilization substance protein A